MIGKEIVVNDLTVLKNNDFKNEKELQNFLFFNAKQFIKEQFEDELIEIYKEYDLTPTYNFGPRHRRIDLYAICENKNYIIELKNPKFKSENTYAIGQILDYARKISDPKKEMVIITTFFDLNTAKTIEYYKLPIKLIYFSKKMQLEYKGCA